MELTGSDKSGLINIVQWCYKMCENLFPEVYLEDGKKSVIYDVTGAGLHKELATGDKFLLMHEADANLTKLGFYQYGKSDIFSFQKSIIFVTMNKIRRDSHRCRIIFFSVVILSYKSDEI